METPPAPEFGLNGAVLNAPEMTEALKQDYLRGAARRKAVWPRRIGWKLRGLLMFPLVTVWISSGEDVPAPLWFKLVATTAAVAFFMRSFWTFGKWSYRLWGAPYALALLVNIVVYYL